MRSQPVQFSGAKIILRNLLAIATLGGGSLLAGHGATETFRTARDQKDLGYSLMRAGQANTGEELLKKGDKTSENGATALAAGTGLAGVGIFIPFIRIRKPRKQRS